MIALLLAVFTLATLLTLLILLIASLLSLSGLALAGAGQLIGGGPPGVCLLALALPGPVLVLLLGGLLLVALSALALTFLPFLCRRLLRTIPCALLTLLRLLGSALPALLTLLSAGSCGLRIVLRNLALQLAGERIEFALGLAQ